MKKLHFIGIGGIGMSSLAKLMLLQNKEVSGSDLAESNLIKKLREMGALIHVGHKKENVPPDATLIVSSDISEENVELQAAKALKLPLLHRSDLLNLISNEKFSLAVAGTHGKTTTSALLVQVLETTGWSPSFSIGGLIQASNGNLTSSPYFVFEACESDGTLVKYHPQGAILTGIDNDHMNFYGTEERLNEAFKTFVNQVQKKELLFIYGDDPNIHRISSLKGWTYGFSTDCHLRAYHLRLVDKKYYFDLSFNGTEYKELCINSLLEHNVLNALAVFGLSLQLQIPEDKIRAAFVSFVPPEKRLEIKLQSRETLFIDDYGHHPTEIASTLKSVRKAWPFHRLKVLFQPHRFTRIKECMHQFEGAFRHCDHLYITEIYSAGEKQIPGVTSEKLFEILKKEGKGPIDLITRKKLAETVHKALRPFDLVISFGAGDITKVHDEMKALGPVRPLKIALLYGGRSVEHEISCLSAQHVLKGIKQEAFEPIPFYIDREGQWHQQGQKLTLEEAIYRLTKCDIAFPLIHGKFGEDGRLQGMLEMLDLPFTGGPSPFCAVAMEKSFAKMVAAYHGIPTSPFTTLGKGSSTDWDKITELGTPLFVKPVHLGSSVGVRKACTHQELLEALDYAFQFDNKLIIEKEIKGREIEFVVIEEEGGPRVLDPGEILTDGKIYTYEAKYGENGFKTVTRATLPDEWKERGKKAAKELFSLLNGRGYARIDFFLDSQGTFWFNELNPIPGFTPISLLPLVTEAHGYPIQALTAQLIKTGLHHSRIEKHLKHVPS